MCQSIITRWGGIQLAVHVPLAPCLLGDKVPLVILWAILIIQHHLSEMIGPTVQSCKAHWNISKEHLETFILQFQNTPIPAVLKEQSIFLIQQLKKNVVVLVFPIYFFTKLSMEVWQVSINIFHISHKTHFSIINILSRYKYAKHALHKKLNDP